MSYSNFNTFKLFQNVGINSSGDYMVSMKPNDNNVSFHSSLKSVIDKLKTANSFEEFKQAF